MKPATKGQFHQVLARLLTNTPYEEINFEGTQSLVNDPERLVEDFCRFLSQGGMPPPNSPFPIWKITKTPNEPPPVHLHRLQSLNVEVTPLVKRMIDYLPDTNLKSRATYFIKVTPNEVMCNNITDDKLSLKDFYTEAKKKGLKLCNPVNILYLRTRYKEQLEFGHLMCGMETIWMDNQNCVLVLDSLMSQKGKILRLDVQGVNSESNVLDFEAEWIFEFEV